MLRDAASRHEEEEEEEEEENSSNFMPRLTFDRFSFAIVERKKKGRKKKKVRCYTMYIYIIYMWLTVRKLSFCAGLRVTTIILPSWPYLVPGLNIQKVG